MAAYSPFTVKRPGDDATWTFDFSRWQKFADDPIASATVAADSGLTCTTPASVNADGDELQTNLSSGTDGTDYDLTFTITTESGDVIVEVVQVRVRAGGG